MAYTPEQIAHVAESLYFRYAGEILGCLSEEENLKIVRNINSFEGLPLYWIKAWKRDGRRRYLGQWIGRENVRRYKELVNAFEEDRALEELHNPRRERVIFMELSAEKVWKELQQRNAQFMEAEGREWTKKKGVSVLKEVKERRQKLRKL